MERCNPLSVTAQRRARSVVARAAALLALASAAPSAVSAADASFGCQVLLCAAASEPSWAGIPYCVPVMERLFDRLARGDGWPRCSEGNAGAVGYERFQPCPTGFTPVNLRTGEPPVRAGDGDRCADLSKPRRVCGTSDRGDCRTSYPTVARERRAEPYFVDIGTPDGARRFYFALRGR